MTGSRSLKILAIIFSVAVVFWVWQKAVKKRQADQERPTVSLEGAAPEPHPVERSSESSASTTDEYEYRWHDGYLHAQYRVPNQRLKRRQQ